MKYPNWNCDEATYTKLITEIMTGKRPNMRTLGMTIDLLIWVVFFFISGMTYQIYTTQEPDIIDEKLWMICGYMLKDIETEFGTEYDFDFIYEKCAELVDSNWNGSWIFNCDECEYI